MEPKTKMLLCWFEESFLLNRNSGAISTGFDWSAWHYEPYLREFQCLKASSLSLPYSLTQSQLQTCSCPSFSICSHSYYRGDPVRVPLPVPVPVPRPSHPPSTIPNPHLPPDIVIILRSSNATVGWRVAGQGIGLPQNVRVFFIRSPWQPLAPDPASTLFIFIRFIVHSVFIIMYFALLPVRDWDWGPRLVATTLLCVCFQFPSSDLGSRSRSRSRSRSLSRSDGVDNDVVGDDGPVGGTESLGGACHQHWHPRQPISISIAISAPHFSGEWVSSVRGLDNN